MTPEKNIHEDTRSRVNHGRAHGVPSSGHTTCVHVISQGRRLRGGEHQGTGSQNTCRSDDGRGPREPPRYAKGRRAIKRGHPGLRQPH